jgi:Tol biopolymer transport system component
MMKHFRIALKTIYIAVCLSAVAGIAHAQYSTGMFGKNRIQYKNFDWQYISSQNFNIFFYGGNEDLARLTATIAEQEFPTITDFIGYAPFNKIKIFVYPSIKDIHQSNIGVDRQGFVVTGQTRFAQSEIEIAFTGLKSDYRSELRLHISEMLISEMMYGGNLRDVLQSSYLLNLPDWFLSGAARYIAYGWNSEMDDYIRDALENRKLKKIANMEGEEAHMIGHSIWNFIVEKHGKTNVANILNLTRLVRNEESSIENTLGIAYQRFLNNWRNFYLDQAKNMRENHQYVLAESRLFANEKNMSFNRVKINPKDNNLIAYAQNNKGRYHIRLRNLNNKKETVLLRGGNRILNQEIDRILPLFVWKNAQTLLVINEFEDNYRLSEIRIGKKRKITHRPFPTFSSIRDMDISEDGKKLVISATQGIRNDIYTYDLEKEQIVRITNDDADDIHPTFLKNRGYAIAFSSNRTNDTLGITSSVEEENLSRFNLFIYNPQQKNVLKRISNTLSYDSRPLALSENTLLFLSDQRGIHHLFRYDLKDEVSTQISAFPHSIKYYDFSGKQLTFVSLFQGNEALFNITDFNIRNSLFTLKTTRQQLLDLRRLNQLRQKAERDQLPTTSGTQPVAPKEEKEIAAADTTKKSDEIDTENYRFDTFTKTDKKKLLKNYRPLSPSEQITNKNISLSKAQNYESKFSADNLVTSIVTDPLRGLGIVLETSMSDALENHKFNAGLFGLTTLRSAMYYAEYRYLKQRIDYKVRFDRQSLTISPLDFVQKYALNKLQGSASYPFSVTTRISASPFFANTTFTPTSDINPVVQQLPDRSFSYGGVGFEFVFDNSLTLGPNMMEGTRAMARYETWVGISGRGRNFSNLTIDARTYRKITGALLFAGRFSYGQFFGPGRKSYRLGGMANWIGNQSDPVPNTDPLFVDATQPGKDLSDLLFVQYVGSLRGFNWNKLRGSSYILFNAELRLPLLKYFYKSAITSNFFRNLQFVAFTDIGASWSGVSPFNRENSLNTVEIIREPFAARVSNFKNPFLIGVGSGVRTMLLGSYYTKFDVAWGIENEQVQKTMFYFTLGYDF